MTGMSPKLKGNCGKWIEEEIKIKKIKEKIMKLIITNDIMI